MKLFGIKCNLIYLLFYVLVSVGSNHIAFSQDIIYVKADAEGENTGKNWVDAFTDLQDGLAEAEYGDTIWVARGIYKPTDCTMCEISDRKISFQLKSGVAIYGGFEGNEGNLRQRDTARINAMHEFVADILNVDSLDKELLVERFSASVLSGDIGIRDTAEDNSYHVVIVEGIDSTTKLDAIAIIDGNANGASRNRENIGGGIFNNSNPSNSSSLNLNYCTIISNQAENGGGIHSFFGNTTLGHCTITNNKVDNDGGGIFSWFSTLTLDQCTIVNNQANSDGGGIYNDDSETNLGQCLIMNNQAFRGGGIYNILARITLDTCTIANNQANTHGGGIYNLNGSIISDTSIMAGNQALKGGGVYSDGERGAISLSFCSIKDNQTDDDGGGIYIIRGYPQLNSCTISNNQAHNDGGGIFSRFSDITLDQCTIKDNHADNHGGGVYSNIGFANLNLCTISNNQANNDGGGMYNNDCYTNLNQCIVVGNLASRGGGVFNDREIIMEGVGQGIASLIHCTILNNQADNEGGGMYSRNGDIFLDTCNITGNQAFRGGGIFIDRETYRFTGLGIAMLNHCLITENHANIDGGGMYANEGSLNLSVCTITNNQADNGGGGMYLFGSSLSLKKCSVTDNQASDGGGIYGVGGAPGLSLCTINANQAITDGGGIYSLFCDFSLDTCIVYTNQADNNGGGIYNNRSSPNLNFCTIKDNQADNDGGGIYHDRSNPSLNFCTIKDNQADNDGGGMYNREGTPSLNLCDINNNQSRAGGGIYNERSSPYLSLCSIDSNLASSGGGIYNYISSPSLSFCTITSNRVSGGGGGMCNYSSKVALEQCTIANNQTNSSGGGIYSSRGSLKIIANTIAFNHAKFGGGIYSSSSDMFMDTVTLRNCLITHNMISTTESEISSSYASLVKSLGHNLIRDTVDSHLLSHPTDLLGNSHNPIEALLDSVFSDEGSATQILKVLSGSPALGKGEPTKTTNILIDQRGYSRVIGSKSDSIDIGAYEAQHTYVKAENTTHLCLGDSSLIYLDEITIADSTGGAWPLDTTRNFILEFPDQITIIPDSTQIIFEGSGFINSSYNINDRKISISYQKSYSTEPHFIRIKDLAVKAAAVGNYALLRSSLGDAIQYDNQVEDSVAHATLVVLPTESDQNIPYEQNFENNNDGWQEGLETQTPLWQWDAPNGSHIQNASSGSYAWIAHVDGLTTPEIHSWVYSPCFDINSLERPMVGFNYQSDIEEGFDGAVLQISTDKGKTWQVVGTDSTGQNWYQTSSLINDSGFQETDTSNNSRYAWTGQDTTWKRASHRLDKYLKNDLARFRFAFRSTEYQSPLVNYEGFAFDDVFIGNRTRTVLLENFISTFSDTSPVEALLDTAHKDVIAINYHLHPQDELFKSNPAAPTSRAFYYGKAKTNESMFGGTDFQGLTENLTSRTVDTSSLRSAKFEIIIDTTSNTPISILSKDNVSDEIIVQVAIIEQNVINVSSNKMYNHVLRKLLPSPGGISFWGIKEGETFSVPRDTLRWRDNNFPKPNIVDEYSNLEVVVFVQNQRTKEVYQAEKVKIWQDLLDPDLVKREGEINNKPKASIFPNPAKREFFVIGDVGELQVLDMQGRKVLQQILPTKHSFSTIDISHLAQGVYQVILSKEKAVLLRAKIIVIP